jgi:hypothetical protein
MLPFDLCEIVTNFEDEGNLSENLCKLRLVKEIDQAIRILVKQVYSVTGFYSIHPFGYKFKTLKFWITIKTKILTTWTLLLPSHLNGRIRQFMLISFAVLAAMPVA